MILVQEPMPVKTSTMLNWSLADHVMAIIVAMVLLMSSHFLPTLVSEIATVHHTHGPFETVNCCVSFLLAVL